MNTILTIYTNNIDRVSEFYLGIFVWGKLHAHKSINTISTIITRVHRGEV